MLIRRACILAGESNYHYLGYKQGKSISGSLGERKEKKVRTPMYLFRWGWWLVLLNFVVCVEVSADEDNLAAAGTHFCLASLNRGCLFCSTGQEFTEAIKWEQYF